MKTYPQTTPDTKPSTANAYTEEREAKRAILDELEEFNANLEIEKLMATDNGDTHAVVEASRGVINYLNRGPLIKAFDKVGYCLYNGVVVCEQGWKDKIIEKLELGSTLDRDALRARNKEA